MNNFSTGRASLVVLLVLGIFSSPLFLPVAHGEITPKDLRDTESKILELTRKSLPATVSIIPAGPARRYGTGSGVIVSEDGLVLTAAHVTMDMNDKVLLTFPDGKQANGVVLGMDYSRDCGMVQITDRGRKYPFVELGDSDALRKNEWCIALGHAGGYQHDRTPPIRLGRVIELDPKNYLTTDSALIAGDSGGPLFDIEGRLIGIHSHIGYSLLQNNHVPISAFRENWDRLKAGERFGGDEDGALLANPDRPMIGAVLVDVPGIVGALVSEVLPRSPASVAGLKKGDRIVKLEDLVIESSGSLIARIREHRAGDTIRVVVDSRGEEKTVPIKLTSARRLGGAEPKMRSPRQELPPRTPEETRKLQADFNRIMRESLEKGELLLTDADFQKFRGAADFQQFMNRFRKTLSPEEEAKLLEIASAGEPEQIRPGDHDPDKPLPVGEEFFRDVLAALRPSVARASESTHLVFRGQEWKSLCTIVDESGFAVTKASEIETKNNQKLGVLLSRGNLVPARVVKTFPEHDLALLHLPGTTGLTPVDWTVEVPPLPLGSFLCAAGSGPDPVAIGLVSVASRSLTDDNKGFLGIAMAPHADGVRVTNVLATGNAGKAGVRKGDIITKIDAVACDSPDKLIRQISGRKPGTDVVLHLLRRGEPATITVELGSRSQLGEDRPDPSGKMNRMGTEISKVSSGFHKVLQNDLPILPQQCGGPVVNLDGDVIGINIARAGRIKTFAIPLAEVRKLVEPEIARLKAKPVLAKGA